jgi:6,7-dimethyl-8-ribityllumazine synthase
MTIMAGLPKDHPSGGRPAGDQPHLLIVEARFYGDISDLLRAGAVRALEAARASFDTVVVPGALEVPAAIALAHEQAKYDAYVALGCVIRGETTHYDIVANESARAIMNLATERGLAVGNGILTVNTGAQAWARAKVGEKNKGAGAAAAAFEMAALRERLGLAHG